MSKVKRIEDIVLFQIEQASKAAKQHSQKEFDRLGMKMTVEQWILLKIIADSTDLTQKELALKSSRDPASITRTLDILQNKDYIIREKVPGNRRSYYIRLTAVGESFIQEHVELVTMQRKKSVQGFSKWELELLSKMLLRLRKNME